MAPMEGVLKYTFIYFINIKSFPMHSNKSWDSYAFTLSLGNANKGITVSKHAEIGFMIPCCSCHIENSLSRNIAPLWPRWTC